jgi:hypothetical protein
MNIPNLALLNHDSIAAHSRLQQRRLSTAGEESWERALREDNSNLTPNPFPNGKGNQIRENPFTHGKGNEMRGNRFLHGMGDKMRGRHRKGIHPRAGAI